MTTSKIQFSKTKYEEIKELSTLNDMFEILLRRGTKMDEMFKIIGIAIVHKKNNKVLRENLKPYSDYFKDKNNENTSDINEIRQNKQSKERKSSNRNYTPIIPLRGIDRLGHKSSNLRLRVDHEKNRN